jgi:hypothetical protein
VQKEEVEEQEQEEEAEQEGGGVTSDSDAVASSAGAGADDDIFDDDTTDDSSIGTDSSSSTHDVGDGIIGTSACAVIDEKAAAESLHAFDGGIDKKAESVLQMQSAAPASALQMHSAAWLSLPTAEQSRVMVGELLSRG